MKGPDIEFSAEAVAAIAGRYDPVDAPAPICVGHPKTDDPAYGWVDALAFANDRLIAQVGEVDPALDEMVQGGKFRRVSAAFHAPNSPANPKPGGYYLKHVGLLGAAAPAVHGLKRIDQAAFAEHDEDIVIEFATAPGAANIIADLFARLRDMIIERDGIEAANQVISDWRLSWLRQDDNWTPPADQAATASYAEPDIPKTEKTETPPHQESPMPKEETAPDPVELAAREAELARREAAQRQKEIGADIDALIADGKLLPAQREAAIAFAAQLDDTAEIEFATGAPKQTAFAQFKALLDQLPQAVPTGETAAGDDTLPAAAADFAAPDGYEVDADRLEFDRKIAAYRAANPDTPYLDAARAVQAAA